MTNLITLTIPNDDHVALRAFGKALEEMALAHGAEPKQRGVWVDQQFNIHPTAESALAADQIDTLVKAGKEVVEKDIAELDTTAHQFAALVKVESADTEQPAKGLVQTEDGQFDLSTGAQVDSTNTPWDERIHSTSKALNSDGTWRLRRKPKDMDEADWAATIQRVQNELRFPQEPVPVTSPGDSEFVVDPYDTYEEGELPPVVAVEPPVTPPGDDFHTDAGVVIEQTVAGIPPIPVPPPVVVPPVPVYDFPGLMKFLTERHGRITVEQVNALLAVDGLVALTDLNAHPDKIGPFVARVKAHLGE